MAGRDRAGARRGTGSVLAAVARRAAALAGVPHSAQNFAVAVRSALQLVQCFCIGVPQLSQNFAPDADLAVAVAAFHGPGGRRAGGAAACGGRGGLRRLVRGGCGCAGAAWRRRVARAAAGEAGRGRGRGAACGWRLHHLVGHAEAGAEEQRGGRAAALGHALARALQRLGLGRLQEAAGQPAVGGVPGQLLQPGVVVVVQVDVEVAEPGDGQPVVRRAARWWRAAPPPRSPGCARTGRGSARRRTSAGW